MHGRSLHTPAYSRGLPGVTANRTPAEVEEGILVKKRRELHRPIRLTVLAGNSKPSSTCCPSHTSDASGKRERDPARSAACGRPIAWVWWPMHAARTTARRTLSIISRCS